jgi:hypothetical protein
MVSVSAKKVKKKMSCLCTFKYSRNDVKMSQTFCLLLLIKIFLHIPPFWGTRIQERGSVVYLRFRVKLDFAICITIRLRGLNLSEHTPKASWEHLKNSHEGSPFLLTASWVLFLKHSPRLMGALWNSHDSSCVLMTASWEFQNTRPRPHGSI